MSLIGLIWCDARVWFSRQYVGERPQQQSSHISTLDSLDSVIHRIRCESRFGRTRIFSDNEYSTKAWLKYPQIDKITRANLHVMSARISSYDDNSDSIGIFMIWHRYALVDVWTLKHAAETALMKSTKTGWPNVLGHRPTQAVPVARSTSCHDQAKLNTETKRKIWRVELAMSGFCILLPSLIFLTMFS